MTRADNACESSAKFELSLSARNFEFPSSFLANLTQHCCNLDLPHTRRSSAAKQPTSLSPFCGNPVQLCFDSDAALVALLSCFCSAFVVIVRRRVQLMPSASGNPTSVSPPCTPTPPLCNPFLAACLLSALQPTATLAAARRDCQLPTATATALALRGKWQVASRVQS